MAVALSIGALLLGAVADSVRRRHGKNIETSFATIAAVFIAAELALILHPPFLPPPSWIIVAVVGSAIALSYAIIGDYFPAELIARANTVLNVLHFGWAFLVQYGTGLILEQWPEKDGHYPSIAYQTAFSINVLLQLAALVWFIAPWLKELNWKSQIASSASRRTKAGQFTSCSRAPEWSSWKPIRMWSGELGVALPGFPLRRSTGASRTSGRLIGRDAPDTWSDMRHASRGRQE
ncbi:hypothetical protein QCM77_33700 [Bradyrhizobium sp. SSUT18]|uniref:hypothetical protein n=1 Tax=Bradyrhizobium sp. SSUT18 TaxID=3040602 RepID=UPI00244C74E1|nr:hypothetical protein [Bradyrhizobium sp. SSUT18]MDH2404844.1 hypothetical protein [Bradyrhizobium sp. SSUT18]